MSEIIVCRTMPLTAAQADTALRRSIEINPTNADGHRIVARSEIGRRGGPRRLTVAINHKWPADGVRLSVQFLDNPEPELRRRILTHMNAWSKTANVSFAETRETGQVRIARLDHPAEVAGYWSYIGTQILGIDKDQPTLNLEGFTMNTSEAEFKRVVRHETGHTLGFEHEHMRRELVAKIDRRKAVAYFDRTQGWTEQETLDQVLTPLSKKSTLGTTEADALSIMCYQIPGAITKNGKAIAGGRDITKKDFQFAGKLYPLSAKRADAASQPQEISKPKAKAKSPLQDGVAGRDTFHIVVLTPFEYEEPQASQSGASKAEKRPQFLRVLASYAGARVEAAMRVSSKGGAAAKGKPAGPTRFGSIIGMHERIKTYTNLGKGTLPNKEQLAAFGSDLFEALFRDKVLRLYDEARSRQHGGRLDIVFTSMVPWIAEKPWEFAYDRARASFLATGETHFVRNVLTGVPADFIAPSLGSLRILVVSAQPSGYGLLSIERETQLIEDSFAPLKKAKLAQVELLARATPAKVHSQLSSGAFNVVHFIGHGDFNEDAQEGSLIFEDDDGAAAVLKQSAACELFCQRGINLVFLNACRTGTGGRAEFNKGVAQALVAHGLPALVANQYSVLDSSAAHFAQYFYWALSQGKTIGQAACEARIAVNCLPQREIIDWAVPVVYARDPATVLCEPPQSQTAAPGTT